MSDVVIRAEGLGKKYVIGHEAEGERYTALRDVIAFPKSQKGTDLCTGAPTRVTDEQLAEAYIATTAVHDEAAAEGGDAEGGDEASRDA